MYQGGSHILDSLQYIAQRTHGSTQQRAAVDRFDDSSILVQGLRELVSCINGICGD